MPWQFVIGYSRYQDQLSQMQSLLSQNERIPPIANLVDSHAGEPRTLVLVIGESTNSKHMSLYGYPQYHAEARCDARSAAYLQSGICFASLHH